MGRHTVQLRLVASFNARLFVDQRAFLAARRRRVEDSVDRLNARLALPGSRRGKDSIRKEVSHELARWKFLSILLHSNDFFSIFGFLFFLFFLFRVRSSTLKAGARRVDM